MTSIVGKGESDYMSSYRSHRYCPSLGKVGFQNNVRGECFKRTRETRKREHLKGKVSRVTDVLW